MRTINNNTMVLTMVLAISAELSFATATIPFTETWNNGSNMNWATSGDPASLANPGSGGATVPDGGYLQITMGDALTTTRIIANSTSSGGNLSGPGSDYTSYPTMPLMVEFDFKSFTSQAGNLALYFASADRSWLYTLTPNPTPGDGWTHFVVDVRNFGGWNQGSGTGPFDVTNWSTDMSNVLEIGLQILANGSDGEIFGLDNFGIQYYVPEPESVWMILAVLLSMCVTFRGKIWAVMAQVKARA